MADLLMLDTAKDPRTVYPEVAATYPGEPLLVCGYLGTGGAGVFKMTPQVAADLFGMGAAGIVACYNDSRLNGGTAATAAQAEFEASEAQQQAAEAGVPTDALIDVDLEYGCPLSSDYLLALAVKLGPRLAIYGSLAADYFTRAYRPVMNDPALAGVPLWQARWVPWANGQASPAWAPQTRYADTDDRCKLWQFTNAGADGTDYSLVRLERGLWLPPAISGPAKTPGSPQEAPTTPEAPAASTPVLNVAAALAALHEAEKDLGA